MTSALLIAGSVFVLLGVAVHLMIFVLESVLWSRPAVWRAFGLRSQEQAEIIKPMAFNQGFYNLFLAIGAGAGLLMLGSAPWAQGGIVLTIFSAGSMLAAALVLIISSPKLARAAIVQGAAPAAGIVLLVLAVASAPR